MAEPVVVSVGQIWRSKDKREDRRVRVEKVTYAFAYIRSVDARGLSLPNSRVSRVRLTPAGGLSRYALEDRADV